MATDNDEISMSRAGQFAHFYGRISFPAIKGEFLKIAQKWFQLPLEVLLSGFGQLNDLFFWCVRMQQAIVERVEYLQPCAVYSSQINTLDQCELSNLVETQRDNDSFECRYHFQCAAHPGICRCPPQIAPWQKPKSVLQ